MHLRRKVGGKEMRSDYTQFTSIFMAAVGVLTTIASLMILG
jgi:hypothetical protein